MFRNILYARLTPNTYPTKAVNAMAIVPQNVILKTALRTLEPPVLAAKAPRKAKNKIANAYSQYSIDFTGRNKVTKKGKAPPTVNEAHEAKAACKGFA